MRVLRIRHSKGQGQGKHGAQDVRRERDPRMHRYSHLPCLHGVPRAPKSTFEMPIRGLHRKNRVPSLPQRLIVATQQLHKVARKLVRQHLVLEPFFMSMNTGHPRQKDSETSEEPPTVCSRVHAFLQSHLFDQNAATHGAAAMEQCRSRNVAEWRRLPARSRVHKVRPGNVQLPPPSSRFARRWRPSPMRRHVHDLR